MMKYSLALVLFSLALFAESPVKPTEVSKPAPPPNLKIELPKEDVPKAPSSSDSPIATTPPAPTSAPKRSIVNRVDKRRNRVSVTDDSLHAWTKKDSVCIYRHTRAIACGKVIALGISGAVIQLTQHHAAAIKPGDEARYFEPDKKMPDISDEQLLAENILDAKPYTYNLVAGYHLSIDLMFPMLHFYYSVAPNVAIGINPAYIKKTGSIAGSEIKGFGGMLTAHYFSDEFFRGLWLQLGSGFYHLTAKNATTEETGNFPIVEFTVGWREDWAHGLNIAAAIGGRFLSGLTKTIPEVNYPSLHPIAIVEVGVSF